MKTLTRILAVVILGVASLIVSEKQAIAGRVGGGESWLVTVPATQTVVYELAFVPGKSTTITLVGEATTILNLSVSDRAGNRWTGTGTNPNRRVHIANVGNGGLLRVEIQNIGTVPNNAIIGTD